MARFEYRLNDPSRDYPVLYYYETMDELEIAMRMCCDYFIKEGKTWLKTYSAIDASAHVVYVEEAESDAAEAGNVSQPVMPGWIAVEVREYSEGAFAYPLIHQFGFPSPVQALAHLIAESLILFGQEWEKTSTEVDEDRQAYVYYCRKTGG